MLAPGAVVHGRYEVVRQVGRGGMSAVYEANDSRLRCHVALKEMGVRGPEAAAAFEHEAQLLASLRHPALPAVIDHFVDDDGQFLVMQFIAGEDLETGLKKRGVAFALTDVLPWLESLLGALEYLHSQQPPVVHRDIKPANLKLTPDGQIVLLDFGLAKGAVGGEETTTAPSVAGYTPRYSPLEQIDGTGTDARSDVYALGATVYHLLTGVAPPNALARASALMNREPDPLVNAHASCANVPSAVAAVLEKALALARGQRYASVAAMRADFREAVARPESAAAFVRPEARSRRIDAAVPSQAQVGARIDLIVQVRFPDSPRLGLEDWPSRRLPEAIEQTSEVVRLAFPVDPLTGRAGLARVQVRVVAPDFLIEGQPQQTIDVPPDAYSQRLSFLLTTARPGLCRINVEVYAADSVFLGSVPVETDVSGAPVEVAKLCVSNLVLSVIASQVAALMAREAGKSPSATPTLPRIAETDLAEHYAPLSAGPRPSADLGPQAGPARSADQTGSWKVIAERPPTADRRSAPPAIPVPVHAERPVVPHAPLAAMPATLNRSADLAVSPAPARWRRLPRALVSAAALMLMVAAGTLYLLRPDRRAPVPEASPQASLIAPVPAAPAAAEQTPPPASAAVTAVPAANAPAAPSRGTAAGLQQTPAVNQAKPVQSAPAAPAPVSDPSLNAAAAEALQAEAARKAVPPPPPWAVAPPRPAPAPPAATQTPTVEALPATVSRKPVPRPPAEAAAASGFTAPSASLTHPFISVRASAERNGSDMLVGLEFTNTGTTDFPFLMDGRASTVRDASGRSYTMTAVSPAKGPRTEPVLRPGAGVLLEFRVRRVREGAGALILTLVGTTAPAHPVRFAPITVTIR